MAGNWIKVAHGLHSKPEVFGMSRKLNMSIDEVVGCLVRFWVWADCNSVDGHVDHMQSTDVDHVVNRDGFGDALISVSWLILDKSGTGISIPHFDTHNGDSAKKRALKNAAQARWRKGIDDSGSTQNTGKNVDSSVDNDVDITASTKLSTREDKRIYSKQPLTPSFDESNESGSKKKSKKVIDENYSEDFLRFWSAYPARRRTAKPDCFKTWKARNLDEKIGLILLDLRRKKASDDWMKNDGQYVPMSSTYLNQGRYADAEPELHGIPAAQQTPKAAPDYSAQQAPHGDSLDELIATVGPEYLQELKTRFIDINTIRGKQMLVERAKAIRDGKL